MHEGEMRGDPLLNVFDPVMGCHLIERLTWRTGGNNSSLQAQLERALNFRAIDSYSLIPMLPISVRLLSVIILKDLLLIPKPILLPEHSFKVYPLSHKQPPLLDCPWVHEIWTLIPIKSRPSPFIQLPEYSCNRFAILIDAAHVGWFLGTGRSPT